MPDEVKPKFNVVSTDTTPAQAESSFDAAAYFKEAMAMRRPLQPTIKKVATIVEVRVGRPHEDTWFQCNPNPEAALDGYLIKDKDKKFFFVTQGMENSPLLARKIRPAVLVEAAMWPPEVPYIMPFYYPDPEREFAAFTTAWAAYEQARSGVWTQMHWGSGSFEVAQAANNKHPPTFSGKPLWELLSIGFKGRIIADENHPYVQEHLLGNVG